LKGTQSVTHTVATRQTGMCEMSLMAPVCHLNPCVHKVLVTLFISLIVLSPLRYAVTGLLFHVTDIICKFLLLFQHACGGFFIH
jgi:hypothetical protein